MVDIMRTVVFYVIIPQRKTMLLQQCIESFNRGAVENGIKTLYLRNVKSFFATQDG